MKLYVGVTDYDWFRLLKERQPEEINFWQPNSDRVFHALQEGELFLFKLHSPRNFIVGGGIFARQVTLPVLIAAHIKPYAQDGQHTITNGILLRQDMHTLFDRGYMTINRDRTVEVSRRIKEDFGNGKEYYAYHGKKLLVLPDRINEQPSRDLLAWHNEHVYVG